MRQDTILNEKLHAVNGVVFNTNMYNIKTISIILGEKKKNQDHPMSYHTHNTRLKTHPKNKFVQSFQKRKKKKKKKKESNNEETNIHTHR